MDWNFDEAVAHYRSQGAPHDQQALVELLREVQRESGGVIPAEALAQTAAALGCRESFLAAVIRRYPSLRTQQAPHRLELCGGQRCGARHTAQLASFIERTYAVKSGGVSARGGFSYRVTGCMKNCGAGPSLKWDGELVSRADERTVRQLVEGKQLSQPKTERPVQCGGAHQSESGENP